MTAGGRPSGTHLGDFHDPRSIHPVAGYSHGCDGLGVVGRHDRSITDPIARPVRPPGVGSWRIRPHGYRDPGLDRLLSAWAAPPAPPPLERIGPRKPPRPDRGMPVLT